MAFKNSTLISCRLNLTDLVVAGIKVDVPLSLLREYNAMEENDPRLAFYRSHSVWGPLLVVFLCLFAEWFCLTDS